MTKKVTESPVSSPYPPSLFQRIEVEISIFESFTLLASMLGMLEVGFLYSTIAIIVLATVAFAEMVQLQANRAKEEKIQIKTNYIDWCFYLSFQFFMTTKTWCNYPMMLKSGLTPEKGTLMFEIIF